MVTKTGLMVGLGETTDELLEAMRLLREADIDVLTIGQYLRPSRQHLPLHKYYTPAEFVSLRRIGLEMGFRHVQSGPLVRSCYHAAEQVPGRRSAVAAGHDPHDHHARHQLAPRHGETPGTCAGRGATSLHARPATRARSSPPMAES